MHATKSVGIANLSNHTVHLLVEYGRSTCTVARMLLALREINFLDAFKEVAYLLEDFATELVFYCSSGHASSFAASDGDKIRI
jgi:rhodanese-related sulfurtransferase